MFSRRIGLIVTVCGILWGGAQDVFAQSQLTAAQAKAVLHCPTDADKQFVDDCFTLVERGKLPQQTVLYAFQYARKKPKGQWIYFEKMMYIYCDQAGYDLDRLIAALHTKKR
ncbi:MAG: hypothetical protein Q4D98_08255 [Planctomycetia bacterium]|nr:hypothetical protein [Planctomycetia bacterium]